MTCPLRCAAFALALTLPFAAHAHKAWMLPSATVLTTGEWVTVDAAVSNDLFHFNHVPLRMERPLITAPDGSTVEAQNLHTGQLRTSFDVELNQPGTWRVASVNSGLMATWEENGQPRRWRGSAENLARDVPARADKLRITESAGRVETFVTAGAPSDATLKPGGKGLELVLDTHPADLFAGEQARFRFMLDGKPLAGLALEVVPGGTRYRNQQDEIKLTTAADGSFSVTWPAAGMYWLEASHSDDLTRVPQATERRLNYAATFEVLPQ